ncbi:MAG: HAMP domain-containing sensor histidine kinase [Acidimicrobiales bacterium]
MTRRLVVGYLAITLLVLAILEIPLALTYSKRQLEHVMRGIEHDAYVMATVAQAPLDGKVSFTELDARAAAYQRDNHGRVVVVDKNGDAKIDTQPPTGKENQERNFNNKERPEFVAALSGKIMSGSRDSEKTLHARFVYVAVPVLSGGALLGALRISYPIGSTYAQIHSYWLVLVLLALVTLAAVTLVGVVVARWMNGPLLAVQHSAVALGRGDLMARAPTHHGPSEVRELAASFNRTATRLQQLISSQDAFVADASHQLRTPLTALRLRLENLEGEMTAESAEDLEAAMAETDRLSRLVNGLLALARAERGGGTDQREVVRLEAIFADRQRTWQPFAAERAIAVEVDAAPELAVTATPDHLTQVLDNLIANALDASPDNSTITLAARPGGLTATIHVIDQGPGLTAEQRARAFDRFWRADESRSGFGSTGLGLSIVEKFVRADGGSIELLDAPQHGLDVAVTLPRPPVPPR